VDTLAGLAEFVLHVDRALADLVARYGGWTYAITFLIVFCETGLVVTPFLPGDSLLFAAGTLAAVGALNPHLLVALLTAAAVAGDAVNYTVGHRAGQQLLRRRWLRPEHVERTHQFYVRYGNMTIVVARFVPVVRTFAPFLAGLGRMPYRQFALYNVTGGVVWVAGFVYAGYLFGNLPFVQDRLSLVLGAIVALSVVPLVLHALHGRRRVVNR
jgi:membrane-associated protein